MTKKHHFEIDFFERVLDRKKDYTQVIEILANLYTQNGQIDDGLKMDKKLVKLQPKNPTAYYNLGCTLALKNKKKEALDALRQAIDLGYKDYDWMVEDTDLNALRALDEFQSLLNKIEDS